VRAIIGRDNSTKTTNLKNSLHILKVFLHNKGKTIVCSTGLILQASICACAASPHNCLIFVFSEFCQCVESLLYTQLARTSTGRTKCGHRSFDPPAVPTSRALSRHLRLIGRTRLRIVDLDGGDQPMRSSDGNSVIAFNGEIYNHRSFAATRGLGRNLPHSLRYRSSSQRLYPVGPASFARSAACSPSPSGSNPNGDCSSPRSDGHQALYYQVQAENSRSALNSNASLPIQRCLAHPICRPELLPEPQFCSGPYTLVEAFPSSCPAAYSIGSRDA